MSSKQADKMYPNCIYTHCKSFSLIKKKLSMIMPIDIIVIIKFSTTFRSINFHNKCYQIHTPQGKIIDMIVINLL